MKILVRSDSVILEGYVNAIERMSRPLNSRMGRFKEKICKGAFKRALERNDDIRLLLNHDWGRELGSTKKGNLTLTEDAIGLKVRAEVTDAEVIKDARAGNLSGWSFGFMDIDVDQGEEDGIVTRAVKDLDLFEVSVINRKKRPAYEGTLVTVRAEDVQYNGEELITEPEIREDSTQPQAGDIDYGEYEKIIAEMKGEK